MVLVGDSEGEMLLTAAIDTMQTGRK